MRYALYFTPAPTTHLWSVGSAILGYDSQAVRDVPRPASALFSDNDFLRGQAVAQLYGFHATLKAPFTLKEGANEYLLIKSLEAFCRRRSEFVIDQLEVTMLGQFAALRPIGDVTALDELAADCIRDFDTWRAPLSAADRSRRIATGLTPRQILSLDTWGYPYVLDDFRFHMTLTGSLPARLQGQALATLRNMFEGHLSAISVDAISLAVQPKPGSRFSIIERVSFSGSSRNGHPKP